MKKKSKKFQGIHMELKVAGKFAKWETQLFFNEIIEAASKIRSRILKARIKKP